MKKIALIFAFATVACSVQAQKIEQKKVPASVLQGFSKLHPDVKNAEWVLEDENYEAEYKKNDAKIVVVLSATGKLIQEEKSLKSSNDFPQAVQSAIKKEFPGYKLEEPEVVTTAEGQTLYEVQAEKGEENYELIYEANGTLKEKKTEHDSDKK